MLPEAEAVVRGPSARAQPLRLLHATCVAIEERGVLLLGPSGVGKSDLAIRLIDAGAELVADDCVEVVRDGRGLLGRAPKTIGGLIESRGIGIMRLPFRRACELALAVRLLCGGIGFERLPDPKTMHILGYDLPLIRVDPERPSAAARVRLAVMAERVA